MSQWGDWQPFRNARLNLKPVKLQCEWFSRLPPMGSLVFDYAPTHRPPKSVRPLSQARFERGRAKRPLLMVHCCAEATASAPSAPAPLSSDH